MRITCLTASIATTLLFGFSGVANAAPSCAAQHLPEFSRDLNRDAQWNAYVASKLTAPNQWPGWAQLKDGFKNAQCATAWRPNVYIGITQRSCTFDAPTPTVNGTSINYGATSNPANHAVLHLYGCGSLPVAFPNKLE